MSQITTTQIAPLDAEAGFSQRVSLVLGEGGNVPAGNYNPFTSPATGAAQTAATKTRPNWLLILGVVSLAVLIFFRK